jgi:hypothetical protein
VLDTNGVHAPVLNIKKIKAKRKKRKKKKKKKRKRGNRNCLHLWE